MRILLLLSVLLFLTTPAMAGDLGATAVALQNEQCQKNLKGETQYASMLHDERDQYEQQAAALVIQRDQLKQQIQDQGKQIEQLQKRIAELQGKADGRLKPVPPAPAATPTPTAVHHKRVEG
jgi:TolA-binding protein